MSVKNILAPLFLISSILAVSTTYAADAEHTGDDTVTLANVFGLHPTGTPYPAMDGACKTQLQEDIGKTVETKYKINPSTLIMSATSTFNATDIPLHPLGIAGSYSFGAFKPTQLPNAYVLFSVNLQFGNPVSKLLFINTDKDYNCLISSNDKPFADADKGRFRAGRKVK